MRIRPLAAGLITAGPPCASATGRAIARPPPWPRPRHYAIQAARLARVTYRVMRAHRATARARYQRGCIERRRQDKTFIGALPNTLDLVLGDRRRCERHVLVSDCSNRLPPLTAAAAEPRMRPEEYPIWQVSRIFKLAGRAEWRTCSHIRGPSTATTVSARLTASPRAACRYTWAASTTESNTPPPPGHSTT